jgi:hypothetical protein
MIRRLKVTSQGRAAAAASTGRPVRLLAVSDQADRAFDYPANRAAIEPVDAILGCGDLDPEYLCFLADAFGVPLLYVRGNHDRGARWATGSASLPAPLDGRFERVGGLCVAGFSWPGDSEGRPSRDGLAAWRQALSMIVRGSIWHRPAIMLSHVPPLGHGDTPDDSFHRGFSAYEWLCRLIRPVLWLHGHTSLAASSEWRVIWRGTTLVNVTGAVLIEIDGPPGRGGNIEHEPGAPAGEGSNRAEEP